MRHLIRWTGFTVLVGAFCLWFYADIAQVPSSVEPSGPASERVATVRSSTHLASPLKSPPRIIPLSPQLSAIAPLSPGIEPPKQASFEAIANNREVGRTLFQLAENPLIHVLDYESLHMQGRTFNRIAALIEWHEAPKEEVLDDQALARMIEGTSENPDTLFFGHDYRATDLARFFNIAQRSGIELNEEEQALLSLLLDRGFLRTDSDGFRIIPPEKVLIAIPRTQADNPQTSQSESVTMSMRKTILSHELGHGEFFTNPDYARYCENFWRNSLSVSQREAFTRFLSSTQHYDAQNESLLINEFQAYLAYSGVDGYFFGYDVVAGIRAEDMARLREQFIADSPTRLRPHAEDSPQAGGRKYRALRLHEPAGGKSQTVQ